VNEEEADEEVGTTYPFKTSMLPAEPDNFLLLSEDEKAADPKA
jgi:hypothetical protein